MFSTHQQNTRQAAVLRILATWCLAVQWCAIGCLGLDFDVQYLGSSPGRQNTGIAVADLNNDGTLDLLFSSGRHSLDQSFVRINLGPQQDGSPSNVLSFSPPLPLGPVGAYYQVDATRLSFLDASHHAVLLAGGTCTSNPPTQFGVCSPGNITAAVLLDVIVTGCRADLPNTVPCTIEWEVLWRDPNAAGDRNGAFLSFPGQDPAIVLVGLGCLVVYEPPLWDAAFLLLPDDKLDGDDPIVRSAGLAVGTVRNFPAIVSGPRTLFNQRPAPLIVAYKGPSSYQHYDLGNDKVYSGDSTKSLQPTGLAMGDLNGDGIMDVVEANFLNTIDIRAGHPVQNFYYLLNSVGSGDPMPFYSSSTPGRSVDVGQIYDDSDLPDIALGMTDGRVRLFANLGNDSNGIFLGFQARDVLFTGNSCEVRDTMIVSLSYCTTSIIAAVTCDGSSSNSAGNYLFSAITCNPSNAPTPAPAPNPSGPTLANPTPAPTPDLTPRPTLDPFLPIDPPCFSGKNKVETPDGIVPIGSLKVGDRVAVGRGGFSTIYMFSHVDHSYEATFLQIYTDNHVEPLEISPTHLIFLATSSTAPIPAEKIKIGHQFLCGGNVTFIQSVRRRGVYAPVTYSGEIVVSGVLSSCFVELMDRSPVLNQHALTQAILSPIRWVCGINFNACEEAGYTDGLSNWTVLLSRFVVWLNLQRGLIQFVVLSVALPFVVVLGLLDEAITSLGTLPGRVSVIVYLGLSILFIATCRKRGKPKYLLHNST